MREGGWRLQPPASVSSDSRISPGPPPEACPDVTLCSKDRDMLEQVNAILVSDHPISGPCADTTCHLSFTGQVLLDDLRGWGSTARKARTMQWPAALPAAILPHFVRGLYDGDGGFHHDKRNPFSPLLSCYTSLSEGFVRRLYQEIALHAGIVGGSVSVRRSGAIRLEFAHANTVRLARWMYRDSTPTTRLARKHALAAPYL